MAFHTHVPSLVTENRRGVDWLSVYAGTFLLNRYDTFLDLKCIVSFETDYMIRYMRATRTHLRYQNIKTKKRDSTEHISRSGLRPKVSSHECDHTQTQNIYFVMIGVVQAVFPGSGIDCPVLEFITKSGR